MGDSINVKVPRLALIDKIRGRIEVLKKKVNEMEAKETKAVASRSKITDAAIKAARKAGSDLKAELQTKNDYDHDSGSYVTVPYQVRVTFVATPEALGFDPSEFGEFTSYTTPIKTAKANIERLESALSLLELSEDVTVSAGSYRSVADLL